MVVLAELGGRAVFLLLENAVEIAEVVKTTGVADFSHTIGGVDEHAAGIAQTLLDDVFAEVAPRMQLEEAAEGRWTHAGDVGQCVEAYLLGIVLGDIVLYLQHSARIALYGNLGIAGGCQRAHLSALGELVEDGHELLNGIEPFLDGAQRVKKFIDAHDVVEREGKSLACFEQHLT